MKIFIGMLAYNAAPVIEAAIRSTYPFVHEIIVVDGSRLGPSTDKTSEVASLGSKVKLVSGTFKKTDGSWDEQGQRQTYMNMMDRGEDCWGIIQDADEVYDEANILRFIEAINESNSTPSVRVLSHGFVHFWHGLTRVMTGSHWSRPRDVCAFRLTSKMKTTGIVHVGETEGEHLGQDSFSARILKDVFSYHYGHAMSFERLCFKVQEYFLAGYLPTSHGLPAYQTQELADFMKNYKDNLYPLQSINIKPYTGEQPPTILPLVGSYFK